MSKFTTYSYTIAAGETRPVPSARGSFVRGMDADAPYKIRVDDNAPTEFQTGIAFDFKKIFESIEIINTHTAEQTISIIVADGPVSDNRLVGQIDISGGIRRAGNRETTHGNLSLIDSATKTIVVANDNRGSVTLHNSGTSTMYISTVEANIYNDGLPLAAGGFMEITSQKEVFGRVVSGGANSTVIHWEESL